MRNYDLEFLKKFSMVIAFLVMVTLGLIIGAYYVHQQLPAEVSPIAAKRTEMRIAPAGVMNAAGSGNPSFTVQFRVRIN